MQVQNVLRGTQQAESHTQDLGTEGPEGATTHVPLLDCAPRQVYSGAANAQMACSLDGRAAPGNPSLLSCKQGLVHDNTDLSVSNATQFLMPANNLDVFW